MQLYLVTGQSLNVWRRTVVLTLIVLLLTTAIGQIYSMTYHAILSVYLVLIIMNFLAASHMIYYSVIELKQILDIDIFSITKQVERYYREISDNNKAIGNDKVKQY